jgi:anti-sigma factor RsiW
MSNPIGEDDLQAYVDERLDAGRLAVVEAYLAQHPDVRERVAAEKRQRAMLRGQLAAKFDEPIPARLRIANIQAARRARWTGRGSAVAAAVLLVLAGGIGGWLARGLEAPPRSQVAAVAPTTTVSHWATAAYRTYVVEVAHPVEVTAAQEAHLVQWLSRRLGRPLSAPDLGQYGYRLMGGRLLPAGGGAAAQFMYEDQSGKRLTVYVRAAEQGGETAFRFEQEGEAATFAWIDQGFGFAVTASAGRAELLPIAETVYRNLSGNS